MTIGSDFGICGMHHRCTCKTCCRNFCLSNNSTGKDGSNKAYIRAQIKGTMDHHKVTPYGTRQSKKDQVRDMFDNIAPRYDLLNRLLSVGIDVQWRKKMVAKLAAGQPRQILDIATGTGDVALQLHRALPESRITGLDISSQMLELARKKTKDRGIDEAQLEYVLGDSEKLPFADNTYDAITVAFGVRNFEDTLAGLKECLRVLRTGGTLVVLEFSQPTMTPFRQLYRLYFRYILPIVGRVTSKDPRAYHYLFESVQSFPAGKEFAGLLEQAGFRQATHSPLTLGICTLYSGIK